MHCHLFSLRQPVGWDCVVEVCSVSSQGTPPVSVSGVHPRSRVPPLCSPQPHHPNFLHHSLHERNLNRASLGSLRRLFEGEQRRWVEGTRSKCRGSSVFPSSLHLPVPGSIRCPVCLSKEGCESATEVTCPVGHTHCYNGILQFRGGEL